MANTKRPYAEMETRFVASDDLSVRQLARELGMENASPVHEYARRHKWVEKRAARQARTEQKKMQILGDRVAVRQARLEDAMDATIDMIVEVIEKVRRDMRENPDKVQIAPRDLALLIDRMLVMRGQPSQITEERNLGLSLSGPVKPEQLAAILELTRGINTDSGGRSGPAIPRLEDARVD